MISFVVLCILSYAFIYWFHQTVEEVPDTKVFLKNKPWMQSIKITFKNKINQEASVLHALAW